ncbi:MAG TPA: hypothetical protein VLG47_01555 [Candidatus Saccharimonadales bacterium]|nr:hypothetical protein [Candidatus Saccharimonadales bacterium]
MGIEALLLAPDTSNLDTDLINLQAQQGEQANNLEAQNAADEEQAQSVTMYEYTLASGITERVSSFEEVVAKCPKFQKVYERNPEAAKALFELTAKPVIVPIEKTDNHPDERQKDEQPEKVAGQAEKTNQARAETPSARIIEPIVRRQELRDLDVTGQRLNTVQHQAVRAETKKSRELTGESRTSVLEDIRDRMAELSDQHQYERSQKDGEAVPQNSSAKQPNKVRKDRKVTTQKKPVIRQTVARSIPIPKSTANARKQKPAIREKEVVEQRPVETPNITMELPEIVIPEYGPEIVAASDIEAAAINDSELIEAIDDMGAAEILELESTEEMESEYVPSTLEANELFESYLTADEAHEPVTDEAMEIYREILQIQLEDAYDLQASVDQEQQLDSKSSKQPILQTAESAEIKADDEIVQQLERLFGIERAEDSPKGLVMLQEKANDQDIEQSLIQLAVVLPELAAVQEAETDATPVIALATAIESITQAFEKALQDSHELYYPPAITPELTQALLEFIRLLGYENPGEQLIKFLHKYDLELLMEAIIRLHKILKAGDLQRPQKITAVSDDVDDRAARQLGGLSIALVSKSQIFAIAA